MMIFRLMVGIFLKRKSPEDKKKAMVFFDFGKKNPAKIFLAFDSLAKQNAGYRSNALILRVILQPDGRAVDPKLATIFPSWSNKILLKFHEGTKSYSSRIHL